MFWVVIYVLLLSHTLAMQHRVAMIAFVKIQYNLHVPEMAIR